MMNINEFKDIMKDAMRMFAHAMMFVVLAALVVSAVVGIVALCIIAVTKYGPVISIPVVAVLVCFIGSIVAALVRHYS
jgi:uncharacterized membrane protein YdjX (TVP38/TMEM64 family)